MSACFPNGAFCKETSPDSPGVAALDNTSIRSSRVRTPEARPFPFHGSYRVEQDHCFSPSAATLNVSDDLATTMLMESPELSTSAPLVVPPPPPARSASSSSWFSDYENPLDIPAVKLALPSPTAPRTPPSRTASYSSISVVLPPPPPIRSTSSSSWFSEYEDGSVDAGDPIPAIKLALPSPTRPLTEKRPLKQRTSRDNDISGGRVTKRTTKIKNESRPTYEPRPIDVYCRNLQAMRDSKKPAGTLRYQSLVAEYGLKLSIEQRNKNMSNAESTMLRREYSERIVEAIRARGARFLHRVKKDEPFYDIGDQGAIRKTFRLLQKYAQKEDKDDPRCDGFARRMDDGQFLSEEILGDGIAPLTADEELRDPRKASDPKLEEVFQLLAIPGRSDSHKTVTPDDDENIPPGLAYINPPPIASKKLE